MGFLLLRFLCGLHHRLLVRHFLSFIVGDLLLLFLSSLKHCLLISNHFSKIVGSLSFLCCFCFSCRFLSILSGLHRNPLFGHFDHWIILLGCLGPFLCLFSLSGGLRLGAFSRDNELTLAFTALLSALLRAILLLVPFCPGFSGLLSELLFLIIVSVEVFTCLLLLLFFSSPSLLVLHTRWSNRSCGR